MDAYVVVVLGALILSTTFYACAGKDSHALPEYYCSDAPCLNGGRCLPHDPISRNYTGHAPHPYDRPHVEHFTCQCTGHWTGTYCEIALPEYYCSDTPCLNGGGCLPHDPIRHDHPEHGAPHPYDKPHIDHFTCQCTGHWTGVHCEIALPEFHCADTPCLNGGTCHPVHDPIRHDHPDHGALHPYDKPHVDYFKCQCTSHWTGMHCEIDVDECILSNPCLHGGHCTNTPGHYTCKCDAGWMGEQCQIDVNECLHQHLCRNGGTCKNTPGHYTCICDGGYTGELCQTAPHIVPTNAPHGGYTTDVHVGRCAANPCVIANICTQHEMDYTCQCVNETTSRECNAVTGYCSYYHCYNGGHCTSDNGSVICQGCHDPWHGGDCGTANSCDQLDCIHGHCQSLYSYANHSRCICSGSGYTGIRCDIEIDECSPSNPCQNGGNCTNTTGHYTCICEKGWTGKHCQTDIDECSATAICQNGGHCVNLPGHFTCHCANGWTDTYCQTDINECSLYTTCLNGGTCVNLPGHFNCHCANGWTDIQCQTDVDECAHINPCLHGGNCTNTPGHYTCRCDAGWIGDHCQTDVDECSLSNPCQNGGNCTNTPGHYTCICDKGWTGEHCQTDVDECAHNNPCLHGGHCTNTPGHYMCKCDGGWTGDHCQTDVDECSPNNPCQNGGNCTNTPGNYTCRCDARWTGDYCQTDMVPKCNDTCFLDAVLMFKSVFNGTTDCSGTSTLASNEALPEVCCSMRAHADWQHGEQVQTNGACIDGKIPPSTPIAAVNGTHLSNAGIFYSCIRNGSPGLR